jgi:hypothetical protein
VCTRLSAHVCVLHHLHVVCIKKGAQAACKSLRPQQRAVQSHNLSTLRGGCQQVGLHSCR